MTLKTITNDNTATVLWIALIAALSIGGSLALRALRRSRPLPRSQGRK